MDQADIREIFDFCDDDHTGYIEVDRLTEIVRQSMSEATDEDIRRFRKALNTTEDGKVDFDKFCTAITYLVSGSDSDSYNDLMIHHQEERSRPNSTTLDDRSKMSMDDSILTYNEYDPPVDVDELDDAVDVDSIVRRNRRRRMSSYSKRERDQSSASSDVIDHVVILERNSVDNTSEPRLSLLRVPSKPITHSTSTPQIYAEYDSLPMTSRMNEDAMFELEDKVHLLKDEINTISQEKFSNFERLSRLQNENSELRSRLMTIEERLQDMETMDSCVDSDRSKVLAMIVKYETEFAEEKEMLLSRMSKLEAELSRTKEDNNSMKSNMKSLTERFEQLDNQLRESEETCDSLRNKYDDLHDIYIQQQKQKEDESSQNSKMNSCVSCADAQGYNSGGIIKKLQDKVEDLMEENTRLKQENEDLASQLLAMQVTEGNSLLKEENSWASELDLMSKEDLQLRVQELKSENSRFHDYIQKVLTRILNSNEALLEAHHTNN